MRYKETFTRVITILLGVLCLAVFCAAQGPGDLDPTFGTGGKVTGWTGEASSVAIQSDGKIVVAGNNYVPPGWNSDFVIARYNIDGSADTSFGTNGRVVTPVTWRYDSAVDVFIQPDGKIDAAGAAETFDANVWALVLVRYNPNGSLDTEFGAGGIATTPGLWGARSVAMQSDGKLVASTFNIQTNQWATARYLTNGSLDTTFGGNGIVSYYDAFYGPSPTTIQTDGKIVTGGFDANLNEDFHHFVLVRQNTDGTLDPSFNDDGIVRLFRNDGNYNAVTSVVIQPDGKLVAGTEGGHIVRLLADGSLDAGFGSAGIVDITTANLASVALQLDGKTVVAGTSYNGSNSDFVIVRYNLNGTFDPSFGGGDGISKVDFNNSDDQATGMALDSQGRAVVVGYYGRTGSSAGTVAIARFLLGDGPPPTPTITVTNTNDSGAGSLRQAIADATPGSTINFDASVFATPQTITLTSNSLVIEKALTIQGPGANLLSISGNGRLNVFFINTGGTVALEGMTITNGRSIQGGGIWNQFATLTVSNCTISGNTANAPPDTGGGGGGGIINVDGILTVRNSIVSANISTDSCGGGISNAGLGAASLTVTNSTISRNTADCGGGISNRPFGGTATMNVTNTTITGNSTGIYAQGHTQLMNSIVAGNTGADIDAATIGSASHNLVGDAASAGGITNGLNGNIVGVDPKLGPSRNNGGPTFTHALLPASPAINAGDNCVLVANGCGNGNPALPTDQRGMPRNGTVDIGAFERQENETPSTALFDFDGDGRADLSVYRPSNNVWYLLRGTAGYMTMTYGEAGDLNAPADYDGDGKTDVAVFRPSNGTWYIFNSSTQSFSESAWGRVGDMPVPADHDGDGKADLVVFRPSTGTWYTRFSNNSFSSVNFGVMGDKPVAGDFDGDGKADIAVFRPSDNSWYISKAGFGFFVQTWGEPGDIPVPADYDGDGKTDVAVFRPSTGQWFRIRSSAGFDTVEWGTNGDLPVPADYDGDRKADAAVFRPSNAAWYIAGSSSGQLIQPFGLTGDLPTESAFIY